MKLLLNIAISLLGFLAIILEFFVPSAGIIGLIGGGFVITGIVFTYINFGSFTGSIFLAICLITGPVIIYFYFKLFPKSRVGKRLILNKEFTKDGGFIAGVDSLDNLMGKEGLSLTKLRPVGEAEIDNEVYNVVTNGEFIEKNKKIYVIEVDGNRVVVSDRGDLC